jgi:hypothetical protein
MVLADRIERRGKSWHLSGDFAPAFGLLDNRELRSFINSPDIRDSSTEDCLHILSRDAKTVRAAARQLDTALTEDQTRALPQSSLERSRPKGVFLMIKGILTMLRLLRIRDDRHRTQEAKRIIRKQEFPPVIMQAWEALADGYLDNDELQLGEALHRKIQTTCFELGLMRSAAYSAARVGHCLFFAKQTHDAVVYLKDATQRGLKSDELTDILALATARLEKENT